MFTAATLILLFWSAWEFGRRRRMGLWLFLAAGLMLAVWCAYFAVFGFRFVCGSQADSALRVEAVCAGWVLAVFAVVVIAGFVLKDGRILRGVLSAGILLSLLLFGVWAHRRSRDFSAEEEARFHRNLIRCAGLVEQGGREALAEAVPAISGGNLREVNERFEAVLKRMEEAE